MQSNIKQMQGTSAFIETHYEAMAYWRQEKKVCHYKVYWECTNQKSAQCNKECIGYTKCSDFISDERYSQKQANLYKAKMKQKSNSNKQKSKLFPLVDDKKKVKAVVPKHKQRKISENALGNDTTSDQANSMGSTYKPVVNFGNGVKSAAAAQKKLEDSTKKATEALKKQKEALQDELDELDNLYDAINWFYDKKIEKIDDSIDAINDEIDALEKQKDNLDDIIEAIERNYDYEISKIQEKIDAIKDENDEQERALKLEEAKRKLLEAKSRKSVQVYSKGIGFTYQVDSSAIKESQDELDDLQEDAVIAELEKEIEKLEEAKNLWSEIPDAYNQAMQDIAASKYFGSDWKNLTLFPSDELLNNFKGNYTGIQGAIDSKNNQIDSLEKQKAQIEELKSLWEDAKNSYRDSQHGEKLAAFFGSDYEYQLLNNSASWRRKFADEYASISKQIEDIENQLKLANEETASSVESVGTAVESTKSKLEGTGSVSKYL